ncbi:hypothetical protein F7R91_14420 [Streptomyces luteolifulvus]|uniref:Uncharacterized protein n=1 Tax=Streptomyces luteolifulvus TaxID=2615112 RepID=A0A6H9UZV5_9ACTN|nr:hypothetical protein [Streptomyces luteolifulvus]KAB1146771.1 hypothetical protein F7R91_14420 [Streptomyces luteolifulvus]
MLTHPYTDDDLRAEAARQLRAAVDPEEIGESTVIEGHKIPSRGDFQWDQLDDTDFTEADRGISELVEDAVDMSRWSVDLGASYLKHVTNLVWGHGTNWDLAVQVAHRPGLKDDFHDELVTAVRRAINRVLDDRGIDTPELEQHGTPEEAAS